MVHVLGRPPFSETQLTTSGDLSYVGGNWSRDIAFAGTSIPLTVSTAAVKCINTCKARAVPGCAVSAAAVGVRLGERERGEGEAGFAVSQQWSCRVGGEQG
eukprot:314337-Chlamydomonas_euryale.AAC.1